MKNTIVEDPALQKELEHACWVAHTLFQRNKATGSSANLSFRYQDTIYITSTGSCFGSLTPEDFSGMTLDGQLISGRKPSKEFPLHQAMYQKDPSCGGVYIRTATIARYGPACRIRICLATISCRNIRHISP